MLILVVGAICASSGAYSLVFGLLPDNSTNLTNVVFGLILLLYAGFVFLLARVHRVETSPDGLTFYNMGVYAVRGRWEDVDRVARVPFRFMGEVECILLSRSTVRGGAGWASAVPKSVRELTIPLGQGASMWSGGGDLKHEALRHAARDGS